MGDGGGGEDLSETQQADQCNGSSEEIAIRCNTPPVVNAGPDLAIALPAVANLNGSVTDDGRPYNTLTIQWSKVSGPGTVTFSTPTVATTSAAFSAAGTYVLRLAASDGLVVTADDVTVTVTPQNQAPVVSAGADLAVALPAAATLAGTVTDDGLPSNTLAIAWSKISGPGTVTFANPNAAATTATFSAAGVYVLRLAANDGALTSTDDVMVTVTPQNQAPSVNAGPDLAVALPASATLAGSATDDGLPSNTLTIAWSKVSGPGTVTFGDAAAATTTASFSSPGVYVLRLSANDGALATTDDVMVSVSPQNQAPVVDAGSDLVVAMPNSASLAGTVSDDGLPAGSTLAIAWTTLSGPGTVTFGSPSSPATSATFSAPGTYVLRLSASDGELTAVDDVSVSVSPQNQAPVVDAGSDLAVALPNSASLTGSVSDDGLPAGSSLAISWSMVSGPAAVTFSNPGAPATSASFGAPGTYVLRLSASDGELASSDDITVTVSPQNQAPIVGAGADQTIELPDTATLSGVVNDDGLPAGSTLAISWSKVSGPGDVTFATATSPFTTAEFSAPGDYVLRLTASDGQLQSSDELAITVLPQNQAPVVDAGPDQEIELPATATLAGSVTDDGYPVGSTLTIGWSKVSGPGDVTFSSPDSMVSVATFGAAGTYVLRLSASDSRFTITDDVTVTVQPENQAPVVDAGPDQEIELPATATLAGTVTDDGYPVGSSLTIEWTQVSGPGTVTFSSPNSLVSVATFSAAGTYVVRLSASDTRFTISDTATVTVQPENHAPTVDAGADQAIELPASATLSGAVGDDGLPAGSTLTVAWSQVSGPGTVTFGNPNAATSVATFSAAGDYVLRLSASDGRFTVTDDVAVAVAPENHAPTASAGPDQTIELPATATLSGAVTDDGLPAGSALTSAWSQVSGPGTVTFSSPGSAVTVASFSAPGTYVVRLTASDTRFTVTDEATITVLQNEAPAVFAGADQIVYLPATASLTGVASDDGLPLGSTLAVTWSQVSGPGTTTFSDPTAASTTAAFDQPGAYVLRLSASDGALTVHDDIAITVIPANTAPVVNAGADQDVYLPALATLNGSVADDGLPVGSTVAISWSQVSGPGTVTFGAPASASTVASFSGPGTYVVRLTASDGEYTTSDDVTLTVFPLNQAPTVDAGADQTVYLPANATLNGAVTDDGLPAGSTVALSWSKVSGPGNVTFSDPNGANTTAAFSAAGTYVLRLSASDGEYTATDDVTLTVFPPNQAPVVNAGADQNVYLPANATLNGSVSDDGLPAGSTVAVSWSTVSGPGTVTFSDANSATTTASFGGAGTYVLRLTASDGEYTSTDDVTLTVFPPNQAPVVDAGADQNVYLPAVANLAGSVTDDGLPAGSTVAVSWSQVSGPGTVTFGDANSATTVATFSGPGTYVLRLSASDGEYTSTDDVTLIVFPLNTAPTVNAGAGQTVFLPANATLDGAVSDDGLPAGSTVAITWSQVSGPGTVTFSNPNSAATTAAFSTAGTYVLRLTASDGQYSTSDDVGIIVIPPNQAPVVNAGTDQSVGEGTAASLSGTVTDDGLPQGSTVTVSWSKLSGPGTVAFSNPNSTSTSATFSTVGTYVLRLTATDGALTAFDDVNVSVIVVNHPPVVNAGPDIQVFLPSAITLVGSATDDGLPAGSTLSFSWTKVSGPGPVNFTAPTNKQTNATFTLGGTYVLRLTASDGQLTGSDDVVVTVITNNRAPTVNAGPDLTVSILQLATLTGVVTDDGLPAGFGLTITWSMVSGPGTVTFATPNLPITTATFSEPGTYTLRLSAFDGEFTGSDTAVVTITP